MEKPTPPPMRMVFEGPRYPKWLDTLLDLDFELDYGFQHLYLGCYWETYDQRKIITGELDFTKFPMKKRTDIWFGVPFIALKVIYVR